MSDTPQSTDPRPESRLDARTVVITGASAGIGAELARQLATTGHRLVLAARSTDALDAVAAECRARGAPNARAVTVDVTRRADVDRLAGEAITAFGGFDAWVNNAGRGITRPVLALTEADVDEMMAVNVKSALYGMQAACAHFLARGDAAGGPAMARGHVVNVSSFLARVPYVSARSAYSAAKAAVNALSLSLRSELAARGATGIHVSVVMPAMVQTEFAAHALGAPPAGAPPAGAPSAGPGGGRALPPGIPADAPPPQTPEEVARIIAQLLDAPRPVVYTNPASPAFAERFDAAVGA